MSDLIICGLVRELVESFDQNQSQEQLSNQCSKWMPLVKSSQFNREYSLKETHKRLQKRLSRYPPAVVSEYERNLSKCKQVAEPKLLADLLAILTNIDHRLPKWSNSSGTPLSGPHFASPPLLPPLESLASSSGVSSNKQHSITPQLTDDSNSESNSERTPYIFPTPNVARNHTRFANLAARNASEPDCSKWVDEAIVQDLKFILNGVTGRYITKEHNHKCFSVSSSLEVSPLRRAQIESVTSCAVNYHQTRNICDRERDNQTKGSISGQFYVAINEQLYTVGTMITCLGTDIKTQQADQAFNSICQWAHSTRERMSTLYLLATRGQNLKGGKLLTQIMECWRTCADSQANLMESVLMSSCRPLISHIYRWIALGIVEDRFREFFIECHSSSDESNMWDDKFSINKEMVPEFMSHEHCAMVLLAGKSMHFMLTECNVPQSCDRIEMVHQKINCMQDSIIFDPFKVHLLHDVMSSCCDSISGDLLGVLKTQFQLVDSLKAMHNYILLGEGEFAYCLIEHVGYLLNCEPQDIIVSDWSFALETALTLTVRQPLIQHLLGHIHVHKMEPSPGEDGWNVFMLKYKVHGPLAVIIDSKTEQCYSRIFCLVLRMKRLVFLLMDTKIRHRQMLAVKHKFPQLKCVIVQLDLLCNEMYHFVREMHSYVVAEVLPCAWRQLESKLGDCKDLDSVRDTLNDYVEDIMKQCLLTTNDNKNDQKLQEGVLTLLNCVLQVCNEWGKSVLIIEEALATQKQFDIQRHKLMKKKQFEDNENMQDAQNSRRQRFVDDMLAHFPTKCTQLTQNFRMLLSKLLVDLASSESARLRALCLRLDMSSFYRNRDNSLKSSLSQRRQSLIPRTRNSTVNTRSTISTSFQSPFVIDEGYERLDVFSPK